MDSLEKFGLDWLRDDDLQECDWGACASPAVALRQDDEDWLSVCIWHALEPVVDRLEAAESRLVVDDAMVERGAEVLDPEAFEIPLRHYGEGAAAQSRNSARESARAVLEAALGGQL